MALLNLFSKRQRKIRGEIPDVYEFDKLPNSLRVQIVQILDDALGEDSYYTKSVSEVYHAIHGMLAREFGVFSLGPIDNDKRDFFYFILNEEDITRVLDCVELGFRFVDKFGNDNDYVYRTKPKQKPGDAIDELNARFREHGIGYQFESNEIIRTDSSYLHAEAVKPTLAILHEKQYAGAEKEFLNAHEHYRHGKYEETITECLKALESTLKSICDKKRWSFKDSDTAKTLLDICFQKGLVPPYLQSEFSSLRSVLESGVPTIRNKQSGHGSGTNPRVVPEHLASYVLHLTAASILFLTRAAKKV